MLAVVIVIDLCHATISEPVSVQCLCESLSFARATFNLACFVIITSIVLVLLHYKQLHFTFSDSLTNYLPSVASAFHLQDCSARSELLIVGPNWVWLNICGGNFLYIYLSTSCPTPYSLVHWCRGPSCSVPMSALCPRPRTHTHFTNRKSIKFNCNFSTLCFCTLHG